MKLDLHGVRHHEVDLKVENFILLNQDSVPLTIICGNSQIMIDLVYEVINRIGCKTVIMDLLLTGLIQEIVLGSLLAVLEILMAMVLMTF